MRRRYSSTRFGAVLLAALTALAAVATEIGVSVEGASFAWADVGALLPPTSVRSPSKRLDDVRTHN